MAAAQANRRMPVTIHRRCALVRDFLTVETTELLVPFVSSARDGVLDAKEIVSVTNTVGVNFARVTHSAMNLSPRCVDLWNVWLHSNSAASQTASAVVIRANVL